MKNSISAYERKKSQLIRISDIVFDFSQHIYPHWYPILEDTRLCCHYHLHEHIEIIVVDEGYVTFQVNGHQHDLSKNDILFINPFEPHSASIPSGCNRIVYHAVNLDLNLLKTIPSTAFNHMLDDLTNGKSAYNNILSYRNTSDKLLSNLRSIINNRSEQNELYRIGAMFNFFATLGQPISIGLEKENKRSAEFIKAVVLYIQTTPAQDISLETISNMLSYNKAYFTTLFKKNFGISFTDYVNKYKIEMAKGYIRNGNYNLNEVAIKTGFNYYAYFFKKFKSITGISPSDFVEQCRMGE